MLIHNLATGNHDLASLFRLPQTAFVPYVVAMSINDNDSPDRDPVEPDIEIDASEDHSLEMLGRVYSQAVSRREAEPPAERLQLDSDHASSSETEPAVEVPLQDPSDDACPISPWTILEAMLFVGMKESGLTSRKAASLIRGVSPQEIERMVDELNESYEANHSAFRIRLDSDGYRLVLEQDLESIRQLFFGRIREARLGSAAIEALAVVAYHQPVTMDDVDRLRNRQSGPVLNLLVRRELLAVERDSENRRVRRYRTTPRFLELFGMDTIEDLPQAHSPNGTDFLDE